MREEATKAACFDSAFQRAYDSSAPEDHMKLKVVLEPSEEGGFTIYAPSLSGCVSEGESEGEALKNIREAIELYLEPVDDDLAGAGKEVREIVL